MSTREITGHLHELYGIDVSPGLISTATPCSMKWRPGSKRPLDPIYPLVFFDTIRVKIRDEGMVRNRAIHIALGVRADGAKEVLSLWLEQNGGARFWLRVMNELKNRGVDDILLAVVDRLKGFPAAITLCSRRRSSRPASSICSGTRWTSSPGKTAGGLATALKEIYRARPAPDAVEEALTAFEAGPWGQLSRHRSKLAARSSPSPTRSAGSAAPQTLSKL
jgi:putative transposase